MSRSREITTQRSFSKGQWIFGTVFVFLFTAIVWILLHFVFDDITKLPGSALGWIRYFISIVLSLAMTTMFVLINYFLIRSTLNAFRTHDFSTHDTPLQHVNKTLIVMGCFALLGAKIVYMVMSKALTSGVREVMQDPSSVSSWILIAFFSLIPLSMVIAFWIAFRKMFKGKKELEIGNEEIYKGIVVDKQEEFVGLESKRARPGSGSVYTLVLHTGKTFGNVQREFYDELHIGDRVEVHVIPHAGEIIKVVTL